MKRNLLLAVCALFAFTAVQAAVIVKQGNKTLTYQDGTVVTVDGSADTTVNYNGVEVFIPKGTTARLSAAANNSVAVSSNNLQGVRVMGLTLNATGRAAVVVNQVSKTVAVRTGTVQATNASGQVTTINRGSTMVAPVTSAVANTTVATVDAFVANDFSNVNTQQATQNVEETEEVLSPSAPR